MKDYLESYYQLKDEVDAFMEHCLETGTESDVYEFQKYHGYNLTNEDDFAKLADEWEQKYGEVTK